MSLPATPSTSEICVEATEIPSSPAFTSGTVFSLQQVGRLPPASSGSYSMPQSDARIADLDGGSRRGPPSGLDLRVWEKARAGTDEQDLLFERDPGRAPGPLFHDLGQDQNLLGGRLAGVDDDVGVLAKHHGVANAQAAAPDLIQHTAGGDPVLARLLGLEILEVGSGSRLGTPLWVLHTTLLELVVDHALNVVAAARRQSEPARDQDV